MGLEAVVEEIREKGRSEAAKIRQESQAETDRILAAAKKQSDVIKFAAEEEAAKQSSRLVGQDISAANLLVKRELLKYPESAVGQGL